MPTAAESSPPRRWTPTRYRGDSPGSGETFEFVSSARTAEDGKFRFVWTLAAGKRGPGEHIHEGETEVFEIVEGTLRIWQDDVPSDYRPGAIVSIAPGVRHRFLNPGTEPAVMNVSIDGTRFEDSIVPLGVACVERKPSLGDLARLVVSVVHHRASTPTRAWERGGFRAFAGLLWLLGTRPFQPALGWDRGDA